MAFAGDRHQPDGGINDFLGSSNDLESVENLIRGWYDVTSQEYTTYFAWAHVWDCDLEKKILEVSDSPVNGRIWYKPWNIEKPPLKAVKNLLTIADILNTEDRASSLSDEAKIVTEKLIDQLLHSYTTAGVIEWFHRPRARLNNLTPIEVLKTNSLLEILLELASDGMRAT